MKKKGDPIDGVLLFDKPEGLSSNAAMQIVRRLANAQKAGHTGTLDPMATGLLPLCFGNATKYSADLLNAEKGYEARVKLGAETDSGDRTGTVTQTFDASGVTADMVREAAAAFLGEIEQIPPMHSALKKDGQCLYTLARRGEVVEREPRRVTIHELSISDFADGAFTMKCLVSKGTYIRVLAEDIGRRLGVGAHLIGLRRTRVGYLMIDNATTLEDLRTLGTPEAVRAKLLPADTLILSLARVDLDEAGESRFLCGQRLALGLTTRGRTRVYGPPPRPPVPPPSRDDRHASSHGWHGCWDDATCGGGTRRHRTSDGRYGVHRDDPSGRPGVGRRHGGHGGGRHDDRTTHRGRVDPGSSDDLCQPHPHRDESPHGESMPRSCDRANRCDRCGPLPWCGACDRERRAQRPSSDASGCRRP